MVGWASIASPAPSSPAPSPPAPTSPAPASSRAPAGSFGAALAWSSALEPSAFLVELLWPALPPRYIYSCKAAATNTNAQTTTGKCQSRYNARSGYVRMTAGVDDPTKAHINGGWWGGRGGGQGGGAGSAGRAKGECRQEGRPPCFRNLPHHPEGNPSKKQNVQVDIGALRTLLSEVFGAGGPGPGSFKSYCRAAGEEPPG